MARRHKTPTDEEAAEAKLIATAEYGLSWEDMPLEDQQTFLRWAAERASRRKYFRSPKGKATQRKWRDTDAGRASQIAYNKSDKGKEARKRHKAKLAAARADMRQQLAELQRLQEDDNDARGAVDSP